MIKAKLLVVCIVYSAQLFAQKLDVLTQKDKLSIRGLSVSDDHTFWVSGTSGTVGRSIDGGKNIEWLTVPNYENRDFRDVEAFDGQTAVVMAIDNPAVILRTTNGGRSWQKVYEKEGAGMFLDAIAFDGAHAVGVGDPIDGRLWTIESFDSGKTWQETPLAFRPKTADGEAIFAASGSNIQFLKNDKLYDWAFVTGGKASSVVKMKTNKAPKIEKLAMLQGLESTGAFSWAIQGNKMIVVGGDYMIPAKDSGNHVFSANAGKSWQTFPNTLSGFKSCVVWSNENTLVACGTSGVSIGKVSSKNGIQWNNFSTSPFHVVQKAKNGTAIYLAGPNGTVAKLVE
jgi:photosystem II stability/assembly factor-like uncharacterized protein